ncbi:putative tetratricopeptide-like helical domain superfamily [Helianthus debilis subsp. tardiflorus]
MHIIHIYIHLLVFAGARQIFERWMSWEPDQQAWNSYIEFEVRYNEIERARAIYERLVQCIPKAEMKIEEISKGYEKADDREGIEGAIVGKRRFQYEEQVRTNPRNYDSWFDYIRLEESVGNKPRIREVYERAIANVPPADEKRYWQRYINLWISYALYEELDAQDVSRMRDVYCEQLNLSDARSILGNAIGIAPKDKIFNKYIEIELQLGNIDRCRKLYEKYLEWSPENCYAWNKYVDLERSLGETERARALFELAIAQTALVRVMLPKKPKKRRQIEDYLFLEESQASNLKILERAYKWKRQKVVLDDDVD